MATIDDLTWTNNMSASKKPILTDIETAFDSVETHINDQLGDNLEQIGLDCFPSGYTFDEDGAKNYTGFSLFDKQTIVDSYTGGDFTVSTTGAWTDVDATNMAVAFTPVMLAGDFRVTFSFSVESVTSNATNETDIRFRLTDGSTASTQLPRVKLVTGVTTTTNTVPVVISYTYDSVSVAATTVKLQYYITTTTASTIKVHANSNDPALFEVEKV